MGGPQRRSGRGGGDKNPYPYQEWNLSRRAHSLVTILTELSIQSLRIIIQISDSKQISILHFQ